MRKFIAIAAPTIIVVGFVAYYFLGGYKEIIFEVVKHPQYYALGNYFEGRRGDASLEALFVKTRDRAIEVDAPLIIVNYELDTPKNKIKQFIGTLHTSQIEANGKLETLEINEGSYLQTEIQGHGLVMPNPIDIQNGANDFSTSKGFVINDRLSYEIYERDERLIVLYRISL